MIFRIVLAYLIPTFMGFVLLSGLDKGKGLFKGGERIALSFLLGSGLVSFYLFYLGVLRIQFTLWTISTIVWPFVVWGLLTLYKHGKRRSIPLSRPLLFSGIKRWQKVLMVCMSILLLWKLFFILFNIFAFPTYFDDSVSCWNHKAKVYFEQKGIVWDKGDPDFLGGTKPEYANGVSLFKTWVAIWSNTWNESAINFYTFILFLCLGLLFYNSVRRYLPVIPSFTFTYLLLSIPLLAFHAGFAYCDMVLGIYLLGGIIYLYRWMEQRTGPLFFLSAFLFGIALFTKNEMIPLYIAGAIAALVIYQVAARIRSVEIIKNTLLYLCITLVPNMAWFLVQSVYALQWSPGPGWREIEFHHDAFRFIGHYFFSSGNYNILWVLFVAALLFSVPYVKRTNLGYLALSTLAAVSISLCAFIFSPLFEFLKSGTTINRTMLSTVPLMVYFLALVYHRMTNTNLGTRLSAETEVKRYPQVQTPSPKKGRSSVNLLVVILVASGFCFFVYFYLVKPQGPFCWDEAHHSTFSLLIAKSIIEKNWSAFAHFTNTQIYWPFLHSWISSVFLIIGGFSYVSARFANIVIGFASILLVYEIGRKLPDKKGTWVGLFAAALMTLSPMFLFYSGTAMIENLGLLLTLVIIRLQFGAWESNKSLLHFMSGVVLGLLYLTKYIYAVFFGTALLFFWTSLLLFPIEGFKRRPLLKIIGALTLGFVIPFVVWIAIPPSASKLDVLWYRIGDTGNWNPLGFTRLDNTLFYLRSLLYAYGFSVGIFILYLGGLIYGFVRFRGIKVRFLLLLFLSAFIPMSMIVNSQERFIYTVTPALYLLTASFIVWFWAVKPQKWKWIFFVIIGIAVLGDLHKMPMYTRELGNALMGARPFKTKSEFNYSTLFGLTSYPECLRCPRNYFNPDAKSVFPHHDTEDVLNFVWKNTHPGSSICAPFYLGTLSPHLWMWHSIIKARPIVTKWCPDCRYFVSLKVDDDSPHYTLMNRHMIEERTHQWYKFLSTLQNRSWVTLVEERYFPDMGVTARIYVKTISPADPGWGKLRFPE